MAKAVKYTLGKNFVHVIMPGIGAYALESTHETFDAMVRALTRKNWARVPHLINLAKQLGYQTCGKVTIEKGIPMYKGVKMTGFLGTMLEEMIRRGKTSDLPSLLKFSNNLYQNPDPKTRDEVTEFLKLSKMPITDDGCFLAYKCIREDYKDCHSGTYDNTPGETPLMPRKDVNPSNRVACSSGFHFAALDYIRGGFGSSGNRIVMIKINPRDVVAIPNYASTLKGRTWFYEVVKELFTIVEAEKLQDHPEMLMMVVGVAKERNKLLKFVLDHPRTKYAIRKGKIKKSTIVKQTLGRLAKMAEKLPTQINVDELPKRSSVLDKNPLKLAREAAGVKLADVAKELDITPKAAWAQEHATNPTQDTIDAFLTALQKITGNGLSFPKPSGPLSSANAPETSTSDDSYDTMPDNPGYGNEWDEEEEEDDRED